jgi:sterol desaturase/sphingolipid hydroxylase (fatty acid hydroxylase superfamily)
MNTLAPRFATARSLSTALLVLGILAAVAMVLWPVVLGPLQQLCVAANVVAENRCMTAPNKLLGYVATIAAFPAVLILEHFLPAAKSQNRFSAGLLVDFVWFCFSPVFLLVLIVPVEDTLRWVYGSALGLGKFTVIGSMPVALQIVTVALLSDFLSWVAHVVRHKSSFVWEFHKIHHAQEELNYFSTARIHPIDEMTIMVVRFLPFAMLDANIAVPAFAIWRSFARVYAMYTHSNVRTNMGPLKYILVTPQSHRVHHSSLPEHRDKNFANIFSIWDFIFGTQVLDFETYPDTGVEDKKVPRPERQPSLLGLLGTFGRMFVYPFRSLTNRAR